MFSFYPEFCFKNDLIFFGTKATKRKLSILKERWFDTATPNPYLASECAPSPRTGRGGHTRLRVMGWGSSKSDDWRKSLALLTTLWLEPRCQKLTLT